MGRLSISKHSPALIYRYLLSDGSNFCIALETIPVAAKREAGLTPFDVVRLSNFKVQFPKQTVIALTKPAEMLITGLKDKIGSPKDLRKGGDIKEWEITPENEMEIDEDLLKDEMEVDTPVKKEPLVKQEQFTPVKEKTAEPMDTSSTEKVPVKDEEAPPMDVSPPVESKKVSMEASPEPEPVPEPEEDVPVSKKIVEKKVTEFKPLETKADDFCPIKCLNTMNSDWCIRARISKKGNVKTFNKRNGTGTGTLLSVDLIDAYGDQIQATFFSEAVDKFNPTLNKGGVYLFSKGSVKPANQKFTSIKCDYSLTFGQYSEIKEVKDEGDIKNAGFSFTTLSSVAKIK